VSIDYRTLLDDASHFPSGDKYIGGQILATRIPDLCPDCKGSGHHWIGTHENDAPQRCDHPNAPTIADLLRWGEWVATAERTFNDNWNLWGWVVNGEWVDDADLLAALRTEAEQSGADR